MTISGNWLAATMVGLALGMAGALHWMSTDYEFTPRRDPMSRSLSQGSQAHAGEQSPVAEFTQTTGAVEPGNVQIQADFLNNAKRGLEDHLVFRLSLNTHSVSLDTYDIGALATVEDSRGRAITEGFSWTETHNASSHHVMGFLAVPDLDDGQSMLADDVQWVKLVIKGIPAVPNREFRWSRTPGQEGRT